MDTVGYLFNGILIRSNNFFFFYFELIRKRDNGPQGVKAVASPRFHAYSTCDATELGKRHTTNTKNNAVAHGNVKNLQKYRASQKNCRTRTKVSHWDTHCLIGQGGKAARPFLQQNLLLWARQQIDTKTTGCAPECRRMQKRLRHCETLASITLHGNSDALFQLVTGD